jgi:hypothetical protein
MFAHGPSQRSAIIGWTPGVFNRRKFGDCFVFRFRAKVTQWLRVLFNKGELTMEWTTPQHEEICLSCEISSYANAEL